MSISRVLVAAALALSAVAPSAATASDVVTLTEDTFDSERAAADAPWLIKFYAPWCGHCKRLVPAWEELATAVKGEANIAKVDCTVHRNVCSRFGVRGYPTLKYFADADDKEGEKYSGARSVDAFKKFLASKNGKEEL